MFSLAYGLVLVMNLPRYPEILDIEVKYWIDKFADATVHPRWRKSGAVRDEAPTS